jgi:hypothetical protein
MHSNQIGELAIGWLFYYTLLLELGCLVNILSFSFLLIVIFYEIYHIVVPLCIELVHACRNPSESSENVISGIIVNILPCF